MASTHPDISIDSTASSKSTLHLPSMKSRKSLEEESPVLKVTLTEEKLTFRDYLVDKKVKAILENLMRTKPFQHFMEYIKLDVAEKFIPMSVPDCVLVAFEKMLCLYQMTYTVIERESKDSGILVKPVEKKADIMYTMGILLLEFTKFPSSLYEKLKIMKLTFSGKVEMLSPSKISTFVRKYYNWNFMLEEHQTPSEIRKHFYYTLWFNILRELDDFMEHWMKLYPNEKPQINTEVIVIPMSHIKDGIKAPCYAIMDQFEIFAGLVENPREVFKSKDEYIVRRARLIKKALESFDTEGINEFWWAERMKNKLY